MQDTVEKKEIQFYQKFLNKAIEFCDKKETDKEYFMNLIDSAMIIARERQLRLMKIIVENRIRNTRGRPKEVSFKEVNK